MGNCSAVNARVVKVTLGHQSHLVDFSSVLTREATFEAFCLIITKSLFVKGSSQNGKNSLPQGATSFLLE